MPRGKGFQGILGAKKGSTWGTAVACGVGNGVYVTSFDPAGNTELVEDATLTGKVTRKPSLLGNKTVDVTLEANFVYEGLEPLIAFVMGTAGAPATVDVSAYKHTFKVKDDLDGIFSSVAYEMLKDTTVVECPSVKWISLTLKGSPGAPVTISLKGIADDYLWGTSATNTTVTIDTITMPSNREVAMFSHSRWEVNAQSGIDFGVGDVLYVSDWEWTVERSQDRLYTTERGNKSSEPVSSGFAKVSGSWTFPVLADGTGGNATLAAQQLAGTPQKARFTLTGATLIGSATQYTQMFGYFPYVQLMPGKPSVSSAGANSWTQPWESTHVLTIPTGFPATYIDAVTINVCSLRSTDALA